MGNEFHIRSRSLDNNYVYYDRLKGDTPAHRKLHESVVGRMTAAASEAQRVASLSKKIRGQADKERAKEIALINTYFGGSFKYPLDSPAGTKEFIDVINNCLGLHDVYERNKQLIMNTEGQKGVFTYFGFYLEKALEETWPTASKNFQNNPRNLEALIKQWLEDCVPLAVEKMFNADVENTKIDPKLQGAYRELLQYIGKVSNKGSFSQQLANIYHLDDLTTEIMQQLSGQGAFSKTVLKGTKAQVHQRGGYALEAFVDLMAERLFQEKNLKGAHGTIGGLGARADNYMTYGVDVSPIVKAFENVEGSVSRKRNIDLFSNLETRLEGLNPGFIVYTSDKNYTLNQGFRNRGGFSAGEDMTAKDYKTIMAIAGRNVNTFVGAILQFTEGAVADTMSKKPFEEVIAQNIAYLLFDDFNAIGANLTNGVNTLHLMNLNGIFVPISSILYALADAIDGVISVRPEQIVQVDIKPTEIKFKTDEEEAQYIQSVGGTATDAWIAQQKEALNETYISTHFLASLRTLLQGAMFR